MKLSVFFFFFVLLFNVWAEQATPAADKNETQEFTKKIREEIDAIQGLTPDDYVKKIDQYRSDVEVYIDQKKRVCNGEFSAAILSEQGLSSTKTTNRLSAEERKLCFREMKALQVTFINNMFIARKKYLDHLHKLRIEELTKVREKTIRALQASFTDR